MSINFKGATTDHKSSLILTKGGNKKLYSIRQIYQPTKKNFLYDQVFNGKIDAVGLWHRALTQPEITALYNNGNGLEP
jgi:hypothetical protein